MCIMEVRAGQRSSTIAQACAHNIKTVLSDAEMFVTVLESRGEHERVVAVKRAMSNLERGYADCLELFGEFVAEEEAAHGRHHDHDDGTNERESIATYQHGAAADLGRISHTHGDQRPDEASLSETAHHDASLARSYETR